MINSNLKKLKIIHLQGTRFGHFVYKTLSEKDYGISHKSYQPYLCEEQGKLGHKVIGILFSKDGKSLIIERRKYYVLYFFPSGFQLPFPLNKIYKEPINPGLFLRIIRMKPDIIHLHGLFTYFMFYLFLIPLLRIKKIKVISQLRGLDPVNPIKSPLNLFFYIIQFLLCKLSNIVLYLNKRVGYLLQRFKLCKRDKIKLVPNGIDLELFKPLNKSKCIQSLKLDTNIRYILMVNRIKLPQKDVFTVIDSLKDFLLDNENIKLIIIGDGPDLPKLKHDIKKHKLTDKIIHYNFVKFEEMPLFYNSSDCFILHSKFEGMPKVIQEAFACKTPVIASNISSIRDIVKHNKSGLLVEFQKKDQILEAVKTIFSNDKLKNKLISNAFNFIQDYSWFKTSSNLIKLYNAELTRRNG